MTTGHSKRDESLQLRWEDINSAYRLPCGRQSRWDCFPTSLGPPLGEGDEGLAEPEDHDLLRSEFVRIREEQSRVSPRIVQLETDQIKLLLMI
jgi:hypothetical protein